MIKDEADQRTTEAHLEGALKSRLQHFRDNASSLTLMGIRRLLEEDLGLETYALDVKKRFIKQFIDKNLHADEDTDSKKSEGEVGEIHSTVEENKDLSGVAHKDEVKVEDDSPIMGVLTMKTETTGSSQGIEISESMIKMAIEERADYIRLQSETLTLAGARRYLEEDLRLSKNSLEPFKKFIRQEIEKVIDSGAVSTSSTAKKKGSSGIGESNAEGSTCTEGISRSIDSANDADEHIGKPRGKPIVRGEAKKLDTMRKRRSLEKTTDISGKKQNKLAKRQLEEDTDSESANGSASKDDESQSAVEKPGKKKEAPISAFGKHVEHLKSVIKACGMSIAPTVYKKAKLVEESKREAFLRKELEGILLKEGLSKNPSDKEIKEVRKRKERAKELEGIDMSNIITSSRRRSTMSFVPPRPKKRNESGDAVVSTKKNKDNAKDASKQQEDDVKNAKKKEDDDLKYAKEKEDNHDDEEEEEEDEEAEEEDDDSQNEELSDDDEGSG